MGSSPASPQDTTGGIIQEIGTLASLILALTPLAPEAALAPIIAVLVARAVSAFHSASGTPITPDSVQALLSGRTPLVPPKT